MLASKLKAHSGGGFDNFQQVAPNKKKGEGTKGGERTAPVGVR